MLGFLHRLRRRQAPPPPFTFVAVGYPKVGNTWLRITLGRYVQQLGNMPDLPLFDVSDAADLARFIGPQAVGDFTHAPLEWTKQTAADLTEENVIYPFRHLKVLLLVRHPLDALVSFYMHNQKKLDGDRRFPGTLIEFIEDRVFGIEKFVRFYELWRDHGGTVRSFAVWRYEDARKDPYKALTEVLAFLEVPLNEQIARAAVQYASFDNMKKMETGADPLVYRSSGFDVFGPGDRSDPNAYHVRKGKVGGFRDELTREQAVKFERELGERLSELYAY